MKKIVSLILASLMLTVALASCAGTNDAADDTPATSDNAAVTDEAKTVSGTVTTDGSTSMEKVIGALGESFEGENSKATFTYNPTGSSAGITAVDEGRCDIGLASRALKDEEKS